MIHTERQRETDRDRQRQTDRQTDRQAGRQTDRQTETQREKVSSERGIVLMISDRKVWHTDE